MLTKQKLVTVGTVQTVNSARKNGTNLTKIQGILTSQIEVKKEIITDKCYYYGFFSFPGTEVDIPVVFKTSENPTIPKGSEVILAGTWANSLASDRQSFTAHSYQILTEPAPPSIQTLTEKLQKLIPLSCQEKEKWIQTTDFLFRKQEELKELRILNKFGDKYLKAYLLFKSAHYANYQIEHLALTSFDQEKYLQTISRELEKTEKRIIIYRRKNHE